MASHERPSHLTELAIEFGTDKWAPTHESPRQRHMYTPIYEHHLATFRDEPFVLVEIGVGGYDRPGQGGASLRMWKRYFRNAMIVGIDIEDKSFVDEERIATIKGRQADSEVIGQVISRYGRPLVVVDDGSHRSEDVRATFDLLFPQLLDGGVYFIEDTQTSYWPEWGGAEDLDAPYTTMAMVKRLLDDLNWEELRPGQKCGPYASEIKSVHAYHNLVAIEKGENRIPIV